MTTFDERERSYEAKFARDEEFRFKATVRRNKALGHWAAAHLGLSGAAEDYVREVVRSDFKHPGDEDIVEKVAADFRVKGLSIDETAIRRQLVESMAQAVADMEAGK